MRKKSIIRIALILVAGLLAGACSTTRLLEMGQYRLERNIIDVKDAPGFRDPELENYIRQQPNSSIISTDRNMATERNSVFLSMNLRTAEDRNMRPTAHTTLPT